MIKQIIDNKDIKLYNGGSDVRDFMHVEDVCAAIKLCIDKASKKYNNKYREWNTSRF